MTIAIAAAVSEGLVLAADGRTTRWCGAGESRHAEIVTDNATKVFALSRWAGAVTYGRSHIQGRTIAGIADHFRFERQERREDVSALAEQFQAFLARTEQVEPAAAGGSTDSNDNTVGFLIAGYGADGVGKLYEFGWPDGEQHLLSTTDAPNYHWRGKGESISRLMKGVDPQLDWSRFDSETAKMLAGHEYAVRLRSISLRDAIDFVRLLGTVAIGVDQFVPETLGGTKHHALVGGRLTVGVVTPSGFRLLLPSDPL